ncbi:hypothetical protein H6G94_34175 [Nostoc punctiforme FACHB-252]|uniref:Uncharacterized protein n=1 Tax=Nostoc punctiforme FACHB-252 TaxID=1357509 RepID=A0ABR8HK80_NOSPU|nr:hypothetical protein [Nostoc punctiforme]MBD2616234.1 hypothetical protein [Nostoc punctiforme FACHB-252]
MSIDNWRTRTPEEKEQLREKICNLLMDGRLRNYKEIESELGIKNVTFELDRLIHLEEIDFTFINGFRAYGIRAPFPRNIIYVENEENKVIACYRPYTKADY